MGKGCPFFGEFPQDPAVTPGLLLFAAVLIPAGADVDHVVSGDLAGRGNEPLDLLLVRTNREDVFSNDEIPDARPYLLELPR